MKQEMFFTVNESKHFIHFTKWTVGLSISYNRQFPCPFHEMDNFNTWAITHTLCPYVCVVSICMCFVSDIFFKNNFGFVSFQLNNISLMIAPSLQFVLIVSICVTLLFPACD